MDAPFIIKIIRDLALYRYVPSLEPLMQEVMQVNVQLCNDKSDYKRVLVGRLRELYEPLILRFYELFDPADLDNLKTYIKDRWKLDVCGIAFPESPC